MSGTNTPLAVVSVAALALVGAGGYYAFGSKTPAEPQANPAPAASAAPAVAETEAVIPRDEAAPAPAAAPAPQPVERAAPPATRRVPEPAGRSARNTTAAPPQRSAPAQAPAAPREEPPPPPAEPARPEPPRDTTPAPVEAPRERVAETRPQPAEPPAPRRQDFVVPADSVIGIELEDTVSSETARVEQRVQGRVTRDVRVGDAIVIPTGARAQGEVTLVESGGRFKERARLGIRFHTLVLDDGSTVPIQTETIYREGNNVSKGSAARIGGSAVGGAIIGAIFGGGKGAAIGAAAGAGAGTAATMATPKSHATLTAGTRLTVRLTNPTTVTVESPSQP
jgi:type IV secretory pathway VirB10-like protein